MQLVGVDLARHHFTTTPHPFVVVRLPSAAPKRVVQALPHFFRVESVPIKSRHLTPLPTEVATAFCSLID